MPQKIIEPANPAVQRLQPSLIRQLANGAMGKKDVIPLWFGEPDVPTPEFIRETAKRVLDEGNTFYQPNAGIPLLREAICQYMNNLFGTAFTMDNVIVTASGMQALMIAGQCLVSPGDNIVTHAPTWPNLPAVQQILGASVTRVPLRVGEGGWHLDLDEFFDACSEQTRAILINSPSNPTGWMLDDDQQQAIVDFCRERGLWLIADEVYNRLTYSRKFAPSFADKVGDDDRALIVNSFSKAWAMTGWRLGWITAPSSLLARLEMLTEFNNSCTFAMTQYAGVEALRHGEPFIRTSIERYRAARDLLDECFATLPRVRFTKPDAAFYAFFSVEGMKSSVDFAQEILDRTQVGVAPGLAFGPEGESYLRLCFAVDRDLLETALKRLLPVLS